MPRFSSILVAVALLTGAAATAAADLPGWFNPSASNEANAMAAVRAKDSASSAAGTLVQMGSDPVDSVRAVVAAYNTCAALMEAVAAGARATPSRAGEIAVGVAKMASCPCSTENVWARSRLERRLNTTRPVSDNVALGFACSCTVSAAEAAASAVPEQADAILRALMMDQASCECAAPALAGVANGLGPAASRKFIEAERELARRSAPGIECPAELAATSFTEAPIVILPPVGAVADGEPRSDDSAIDPNRGGEIASPN